MSSSATPPASSGFAPKAIATGSFTGNVAMSNGRPPMKLVEVVEKNCCCNDGALKPFDTEAAQRELRDEVITQRQLAGDIFTEVRIVLDPHRH